MSDNSNMIFKLVNAKEEQVSFPAEHAIDVYMNNGEGRGELSDSGADDPRPVAPNPLSQSFFTISTNSTEITALVVSATGKRAFTGGADGKVKISQYLNPKPQVGDIPPVPQSNQINTKEVLQADRPILALALSPDEKLLAIAVFSSVVIFNVELGKIEHQLTRIKGRILSLAWDSRGEVLAIGRVNGDIFLWNLVNGPSAGRDSLDALEIYDGLSSPVVKLVFHPSGRAFFSAEQDGRIVLWRLFRTEQELGLRDETASIDQKMRNAKKVIVSQVGSRVEDLWVDSAGTILYAVTADGQIFRWKIRGLQKQKPIILGSDSVNSVTSLGLWRKVDKGDGRKTVFVGGGRGQRLKFWCEPELEPDIADEQLQSQELKQQQKDRILIAQTGLLDSSLGVVRAGTSSGILWATQKTGNLLVFDAALLMRSADFSARSRRCH